ncbi:hypothetical protein K493DRAFT_305097 [Basidiobolus meristosporus CBS 931.73]|uniref:N-acetyltransferase domain-containing protein n=1 Tax=Basidiobolus meristosporus CBS 931.73 TaxID=1314790 RepID=A0A1Y1XXI0_9FUNG|nr:hypothetical protein K493DRAFT_305097 [Basidiobolus meristosporus CBS 931.73]|eukprot:ORX90196.1 hypothetical protein K493DRAFT_305097 [Basidiobolus meristosporus CBS 931.73]
MSCHNVIKILEGGFVFRRATIGDEAGLDQLTRLVQTNPLGIDENEGFSFYKKITNGPYPVATPEDFILISDDNSIVAMACLLRVKCVYDTVPFVMGRPEMIATHPDYRCRGFVQILMRYINELCDEEALLVEGITGIPFFYRQFGYEYALALEQGDLVNLDDIPPPAIDCNLYLRSAQLEDYQYYSAFHELTTSTSLVSMSVTPDIWHHALISWNKNEKLLRSFVIYMVHSRETPGQPIGVIVSLYNRWTHCLSVTEMILGSLPERALCPVNKVYCMLPDLLSLLNLKLNQTLLPQRDHEPPLTMLQLNITKQNPIHEALIRLKLNSPPTNPSAWYIRIPDIPKFVSHISEPLNKRLSPDLVGTIESLNLCVRIYGSVHPPQLYRPKGSPIPTQSFQCNLGDSRLMPKEILPMEKRLT